MNNNFYFERAEKLREIYSERLSEDIEDFWVIKKQMKGAKPETIAKKYIEMQDLMLKHLNELLSIDPAKDDYLNFYLKVAFGTYERNRYGKIINFIFASDRKLEVQRELFKNKEN